MLCKSCSTRDFNAPTGNYLPWLNCACSESKEILGSLSKPISAMVNWLILILVVYMKQLTNSQVRIKIKFKRTLKTKCLLSHFHIIVYYASKFDNI